MFMYFPIAFFRQVLTPPGCYTQEFISFEVLAFTLGFLMLRLFVGPGTHVEARGTVTALRCTGAFGSSPTSRGTVTGGAGAGVEQAHSKELQSAEPSVPGSVLETCFTFRTLRCLPRRQDWQTFSSESSQRYGCGPG